MRAVNLLPRDEQPRALRPTAASPSAAAGGAALVTVALTALMLGAGGTIQRAARHARLPQRRARGAADRACRPGVAEDAALPPRRTARITRSVDRALDPGRLGPRAPPDLAGPARGRLADEPHQSVRPEATPARPRAPSEPPGATSRWSGSTYSQRGVARLPRASRRRPVAQRSPLAVERKRRRCEPQRPRPVHDSATVKAPGASQ